MIVKYEHIEYIQYYVQNVFCTYDTNVPGSTHDKLILGFDKAKLEIKNR